MTTTESRVLSCAMEYIAAHREVVAAFRERRRYPCEYESEPEPEVGDGGVPPCYQGDDKTTWCESCIERDKAHAIYREASKRRAAAERKLQSIARRS